MCVCGQGLACARHPDSGRDRRDPDSVGLCVLCQYVVHAADRGASGRNRVPSSASITVPCSVNETIGCTRNSSHFLTTHSAFPHLNTMATAERIDADTAREMKKTAQCFGRIARDLGTQPTVAQGCKNKCDSVASALLYLVFWPFVFAFMLLFVVLACAGCILSVPCLVFFPEMRILTHSILVHPLVPLVYFALYTRCFILLLCCRSTPDMENITSLVGNVLMPPMPAFAWDDLARAAEEGSASSLVDPSSGQA